MHFELIIIFLTIPIRITVENERKKLEVILTEDEYNMSDGRARPQLSDSTSESVRAFKRAQQPCLIYVSGENFQKHRTGHLIQTFTRMMHT